MASTLDGILHCISDGYSDIIFTCTTRASRGLDIQAWNIQNGALLRTYHSSDTETGTVACIYIVSDQYILCGLKDKPLIVVWKIDKVSK